MSSTLTAENLPNSVADVGIRMPDEQYVLLRGCNPITGLYSHLRPYWYRAQARWVLYDCLPESLIDPDGPPLGIPMETPELLGYLNGKPARVLGSDACPFVSDVQHEFWRIHREYARPFWVLQGALGGHQVSFSPWQQNVLMAKGLSHEPPKIGSLPYAPFDERSVRQLNHLNRLHAFDGQVERLRKSGSKEAADAEMERIQREVRDAEMAFIEQQMEPLVDMSMTLVRGSKTRSEYDDQVMRVRPGVAAEASDAYDHYRETGDYTLRDLSR